MENSLLKLNSFRNASGAIARLERPLPIQEYRQTQFSAVPTIMSFHPQGSLLAIGYDNGCVSILDVSSLKKHSEYQITNNNINSILQQSSMLSISNALGAKGTVGHHHHQVSSSSSSSSSPLLLGSGQPTTAIIPSSITSIVFHDEQHHLMMVTSRESTVYLLNTIKEKPVASLQGHKGEVICGLLKQQTAYTAGCDGTIRVWDVNTTSAYSTIRTTTPVFNTVNKFSLPFAGDIPVGGLKMSGNLLISAGLNTVYLWDKRNLKSERSVQLHMNKNICSIDLSPDGKLLLVNYHSSSKNTSTCRNEAIVEYKNRGVTSVVQASFSDANTNDISGNGNGSIDLVDLRTYQILTTFEDERYQNASSQGQSQMGRCLFNARGDHFAVASSDERGLVLIWNVSKLSLEPASVLSTHQKGVNCVAWQQEGKYLASGGLDKLLFLFKRR